MSHWNHRVVKRMTREFDKDVEWFGIHEAFYEVGGQTLWTDEPVTVEGESIEELRETLERMLVALDKPIIDDTGEQK